MPDSATSAGVSAQRCATDLLEVLPQVMRALRNSMRGQLQEGLSVPQFRCLNFIDHNPGASIGEVAAFLGVTMATASAMVDRLTRAGYATAGVSAHDRRRATLQLSSAGRELLTRMRQGARRELATALQPLSDGERRSVAQALNALRRVFGDSR